MNKGNRMFFKAAQWSCVCKGGIITSVDYSESYCELLGLKKDEKLGIDKPWIERVHPEDRERVEHATIEVLEARQQDVDFDIEYRMLTKTGYRWFHDYAHIFRDPEGVPLSAEGVIFDIDNHIKSMEEMEQLLVATRDENAQKLKKLRHFDEFAAQMMRFASSNDDIESIIEKLLQYIGEKLSSDRSYIFEENKPGFYDNTNEWCAPGVTEEINDLQGLPYEGLVEYWIAEFKKGKNIIITDIEACREESQALYEILVDQNIKTLVAGPIMIKNQIVGFFGVDNPPAESVESISELITVIEFVISLMIRLRRAVKVIQKNAVYDALTDCKNRAALAWAYDNLFDGNQECGIIMCDLNGLKTVNDTLGHEAGDKFIIRVADVLKDVFDRECVYRLGGDEFAVIAECMPEKTFMDKFEACRMLLGNTASLGCSFREKMDTGFEALLKEADVDMYKSKSEYYTNKNVDRRKNRV